MQTLMMRVCVREEGSEFAMWLAHCAAMLVDSTQIACITAVKFHAQFVSVCSCQRLGGGWETGEYL